MEQRRFRVGLSFPGEYWDKIGGVADCLAAELGQERVFYDAFWEHEIAGVDADTYLQDIYLNHCDMVVFFCQAYKQKAWCAGIEWRAIRNVIHSRQRNRLDVFPLNLEKEKFHIDGFFNSDTLAKGFGKTPAQIAESILQRLALRDGAESASPADLLPPALTALEQSLFSGVINSPLTDETLHEALNTSPEHLRAYRLTRIAEWSQPRYALDKRFTSLTLLLDQGKETQGERFSAQSQTLHDLRDIFSRQPEDTAFVLLGSPGSGKSTLLRRLELDDSMTATLALEEQPRNTYYISLKDYQATGEAEPASPLEWLASQWHQRFPSLPSLETLLATGPFVLLLDALNEMPHRDFEHYEALVARWQQCIREVRQRFPACRLVFSCRTLDYSSTLSTEELAVPHVRIEPLKSSEIREFLRLYAGDGDQLHYDADTIFEEIKGSGQLDLYGSPYYLKLLTEQIARTGKVPIGRAGLFTAFVREMLTREYLRKNPKVLDVPRLITLRDIKRLAQLSEPSAQWPDAYDLLEDSPLFLDLALLAHAMQNRAFDGEASQVSLKYGHAIKLLDDSRAEAVLEAGTELGILDADLCQNTLQYSHQLLQEYFAARQFAVAPDFAKVACPWQVDVVSPSLEETLNTLEDYEPLPPPPTTGWEVTVQIAAEMAEVPGDYIADLAQQNLPLAAKAVVSAKLDIPAQLLQQLQTELLKRSQNMQADLRHRIAAANALGSLGDPRLAVIEGASDRYIRPDTVAIPGGDYLIGSDEGLQDDESPVHPVTLEPFELARFPVTNAEWRCFMQAGGYDDERWWPTGAAKAWRSGKSTSEGPKQQWRETRKEIQANLEALRQWPAEDRCTSKQLEEWESYAAMDDDEFEGLLDRSFRSGRKTEPENWQDERFNGANQPVVGICWFEAMAYCRWLSAQSPQLWRLPSEAEWQAAAQGRQRHAYPYGNAFNSDCSNAFPTHVRSTTPIGIFPLGDNELGLSDLSGNVWEWTSSLYQTYPYDADDGREVLEDDGRRVLRGGAWSDTTDFCRAAFRYWNNPVYRYDYIGFRVCCSSPIETLPAGD